MLANALYFVRRTWRRPWLAVLYALVYWNKTTFWLLIASSVALGLAGGHPRVAVVLASAAAVVLGFDLGFMIGIRMPGPPTGKRR